MTPPAAPVGSAAPVAPVPTPPRPELRKSEAAPRAQRGALSRALQIVGRFCGRRLRRRGRADARPPTPRLTAVPRRRIVTKKEFHEVSDEQHQPSQSFRHESVRRCTDGGVPVIVFTIAAAALSGICCGRHSRPPRRRIAPDSAGADHADDPSHRARAAAGWTWLVGLIFWGALSWFPMIIKNGGPWPLVLGVSSVWPRGARHHGRLRIRFRPRVALGRGTPMASRVRRLGSIRCSGRCRMGARLVVYGFAWNFWA